MPKLEQFEIKKYWQIFSGLAPVDNKVTHNQVLPILHNSKLDSSVLSQIWFLADIDDDDNLDFEEFVICMRLIFDMVNRNINAVPEQLPDWLVPGSKIELVKQRGSARYGSDATLEASTDNSAPPPEVEWYISLENKTLYESIYQQCQTSTDGSVSFPSLAGVAAANFMNINSSEIEQVWRLVNPKNFSTIDRDPVFYVLHILKQRNDLGIKIPSSVPSALKEVFSKERVSTDISGGAQGTVRKGSTYVSSSGNKGVTDNGRRKMAGTDFSATKGTDWELVRLQRELANLETELASLNREQSVPCSSGPKTLEQQFQGLLTYKQNQLSNSTTSQSSIGVLGLIDDIDSLEGQVQILEQYLSSKRGELHNLQQEIQSLK
ncbi:End3p Ecym_5374 [Eremothecium cymbalariae DBVPG|uniref:Actin cytoskeleton-regulatory complex protein END3 n=1 Tax=Eremothecium cymbalariae (strain CBS 270.75 / DBVPG 7215 / KCTC 17166 / NRRL Y-17582) TaxID=931890 RepID=I6NDI7_ERECY|nr:hypothetical protein Ecym_5374 [Eremothecium cymbalariae DBVPG\